MYHDTRDVSEAREESVRLRLRPRPDAIRLRLKENCEAEARDVA